MSPTTFGLGTTLCFMQLWGASGFSKRHGDKARLMGSRGQCHFGAGGEAVEVEGQVSGCRDWCATRLYLFYCFRWIRLHALDPKFLVQNFG
jgi:hypothetical protein